MEILQAVDVERMRDLRARGEYFWLDLLDPSAPDLDTVREFVTIHPLAHQDTLEFGQRAKLDGYPDSALLVFYGAEPHSRGRPRLVEVHLHICAEALVTVSREPLTALAKARHRLAASPSAHGGTAVYQVLDASADSFLDSLDGFDDTIDHLQEALVQHATTAHRQHIFRLRRQLAEMHQVAVPQRDLLASSDDLIDVIPGLERDRAREKFRTVHNHLVLATGLIDSYREQLGGLLDLYLTEVSNRLNVIMKRLTLIATVFLPLSFLTGFFGMNFAWLIRQIAPTWTFFVFGIALLIASAVAVALYLGRTDR
ncbi:magnesium transporter CorA [Nonomuraea phyllanthi]|uniref:Magnesium transporter CorA n=1 Tax=Nonomuraea phyllanthi TaxID=2219224 RepID=A0A5C4VML0_9ACTN|nr:magnesium transporter CorA family protein [Nonomuraea phyllanthi]KAB8189557.1 magnesium transporter CorA [Nonomuraea phyllanthi]QFY12091.1 magnesium transporter CorA [Nonomuraea phyllanthi]